MLCGVADELCGAPIKSTATNALKTSSFAEMASKVQRFVGKVVAPDKIRTSINFKY